MLLCDHEGIPYLVQKFSVLKNRTEAFLNPLTNKYESFSTFVIEVTLFNNCRGEVSFVKGSPDWVPNFEEIEERVKRDYDWMNFLHERRLLMKYSHDMSIEFLDSVAHKHWNDLDRYYFGKV